MIENPVFRKMQIKKKTINTDDKKEQAQIEDWLNEKYEGNRNSKHDDKNPLFQIISHYPQESAKAEALWKVSNKLEGFE